MKKTGSNAMVEKLLFFIFIIFLFLLEEESTLLLHAMPDLSREQQRVIQKSAYSKTHKRKKEDKNGEASSKISLTNVHTKRCLRPS